jgi:RNA polymerase sigma factor (sigma-70 family)
MTPLLATHLVARPNSDRTLLAAYAADRDEAAFAELVRRHAGMVHRAAADVCPSEAEDVAQASFALLAARAAGLVARESAAGWLFETARRLALKARTAAARRSRREAAVGGPRTSTGPLDELSFAEVRAIVATELVRLPDRLRVPLVLCYWEGVGIAAVADRLGCSTSAVKRRLAAGRDRLAARLSRRGFSGAAVLAVLTTLQATARTTIPANLATGPLSPGAEALVRTAHVAGLRLAALVVVAAVGLGVALGLSSTAETDPPGSSKPRATELAGPPTDALGDPLPPGAVARLGTRRLFGPFKPRWAAFSPDGTKIAALGDTGVTVCNAATGRQLVVRDHYWALGNAIGWRSDGTGVAVIPLLDRSEFISVFTDPNEKLPTHLGNWNPGLALLAFSPSATDLAVVRDADKNRFTIDILPATAGRRLGDLKPLRTLGPFPGPCREVRYLTRHIVFLTGKRDREGDWTVSVVDPDKNVVAQTVTIPHPAYSMWGFMHSLSTDARLAAIPPRPTTDEAGKSTSGRDTTDRHDGTIRIWDLAVGRELQSISFPKGIGVRHALTPDGKQLITSGPDPYFQIRHVGTGKEAARSPVSGPSYPDWNASAVAVSPDGKRFVTARQDGRMDMWDTTTARPVTPLDTHRKELTAVALSPDGRLAATLGDDNAIRVWDLATGKRVSVITAPRGEPSRSRPRRRPAFTPDGQGLLFTSSEELALADPLTGKPLNLPDALRGTKDLVGGFSADGKTLMTFAKEAVTLRNWPDGTVRLTIAVKPPEAERVDYSAALSPDGRLLFTNAVGQLKGPAGGSKKSSDVWDARTGKHLRRLEKPESWYQPAGFAPDGRVLFLGGHSLDGPERGQTRADALTAWDPVAGKRFRPFTEPNRPAAVGGGSDGGRDVRALAVSPDGRLVAVAEEVNTFFDGVWVYEAVSGRPLKQFTGHARSVTDLAFSPNGRRLVSVSEDQTGLVWDVGLQAPVKKPTARELADAWGRLAQLDPVPAYLGIATLAANPTAATELLKEHLRPAPVLTEAELDRLTTQLGSDKFADREKASAELERFGPNAVPAARARLKSGPPEEVRERLNRFLSLYDGPDASPYQMRCVRGVAALEVIGTAEATALLVELAKGKADDVLTREALAALRRLR